MLFKTLVCNIVPKKSTMVKFVYSFVLVFWVALAQAQVPLFIPQTGLVGYWPMGDTLANQASNNHHATSQNLTTTFDRFGSPNKASHFNGINAFATIPSSAMNQVSGSFTVSVWVSPDTIIPAVNGHHIMDDRTTGGWTHRFRLGFAYSPSPIFNVDSAYADRIYSGNQRVAMPAPPTDGWTHYAFVFEVTSSGSFIRGYRNGALFNSVISNGIEPGSRPINIGRTFYPGAPFNGDGFFRGRIDDIGIWNRALTANEISAIYNSCFISFSSSGAQTVQAGGTTQFSVTGSSISNYQWEIDSTNSGVFLPLSNGNYFQGVDSNVLLVQNVNFGLNGSKFRCFVQDSACATRTNPAELTVSCSNVISGSPQTAYKFPGDSAIFTIGSTQVTHQYQWQIFNAGAWLNLADFGQFSGTQSARLVVRNLSNQNHNQQFRCLVTAFGCSDTSTAAALQVLCSPRNLNGPNNAPVVEAQTAIFRIDSIAGATYSWQRNVGFGFLTLTNGGNVQGANQPTLRISNVQWADNNTGYRCIVRVDHCADTSAAATLQIVGGVSVQENEMGSWKMYPNPAKDEVYVERHATSLPATITVRNAMGQVMLQADVAEQIFRLSTDAWSAGLYLVEWEGQSRRLIINR